MRRQANSLVQQGFVGHAFAATRAGVSADDDPWGRVLDSGCQGMRGETAKHHRVNSPQSNTSQHRESGFSDHRHVDQHAVTLDHAQVLQDGGHALHFGVQVTVGVGFFLVCFGRDKNQSRLIGAVLEVAIDRVVAQIGLAAHKPFGKRRMAVVTNLLRCYGPIHQLGLLGPKGVTVIDRACVKVSKAGHGSLLKI